MKKQVNSTNAVSRFRELFWAARREHVKGGRNATADGHEHQAALTYAREHALEWGEVLLEASLLQNQGKNDEALKQLDVRRSEIPATARPLGWYVRGAALNGVKQFDEAIEACRKALDDPNFDRPARALTNLAYAYHQAGRQKEARETLVTALKKPDPEGSDHMRAKNLLSLLDADLKPEAMSADDRALLERPTPAHEEAGPDNGSLLKSKLRSKASTRTINKAKARSGTTC